MSDWPNGPDSPPIPKRPDRTLKWTILVFFLLMLSVGGVKLSLRLFSSYGYVRIVINEPDFVEQVRIDGVRQEVSGPEQAIRVMWGAHHLEVLAQGFQPCNVMFSVIPSETIPVFADLQPAQAASTPRSVTEKSSKQPLRKIVNEKDGSILVLVPAGKSLAGSLLVGTVNYPQPFPVQLQSFYIGITEVTNAQYKRFIDATNYPPPDHVDRGIPVGRGKDVPAQLADHPVGGVSWEDAQAYCRWAGLRLPTELEWEKAARGPDGWLLPWGSTWGKRWRWDPAKCRSAQSGRNLTTCRVWDYPEGRSVWGCYNMAGNVWEWCEDWYDEGTYQRYRQGNLEPPSTGRDRVIRGGGWDFDFPHSFSGAARGFYVPTERNSAHGFRVAKSAATAFAGASKRALKPD